MFEKLFSNVYNFFSLAELYYVWTTVIPFTVFLFFLVLYFYASKEELSPIPIEHLHKMTFCDVKENNVKDNTHLCSAAFVAGTTAQKQTHSSSAYLANLAKFYKISSSRRSGNSSMMQSHLKDFKMSKSNNKTFKSARTWTQTIRSLKLSKKRTKSKRSKSPSLKKKRKLSLQKSAVKKSNNTKVVVPLDFHTLSGKRSTKMDKRAV